MSRPFKFRAWSLTLKRFLYSGIQINLNGTVNISELEEGVIIQQWTGLTDKNEKELFEGDIVKYAGAYFDGMSQQEFDEEAAYNPLCVITWGKNYYANKLGFDLLDVNGKELPDNCYGGFNARGTEIVGNIFETPELLKP